MNEGEQPRDPVSSGRRIIDRAYLRGDGVLDRGQQHVFRLFWVFLPETSVARKPKFQQVMASRFLSDAGQQLLTYGALIAVVRDGGSAFQAALVGVATILPPALFGLYGGAVADALPKRVALAAIYNLQAVLCFVVPVLFGTDLSSVLFLLFAVNVLGQVSGPTESSVIPFVASEEELASSASLVSLSSNLGTAFGTAILAPIIVRVFGVQEVFFIGGVLLVLAASRVFDLTTRQKRRKLNWRRPNVNVRATIAWLTHEPAVGTMIIVAVLAGVANIILQTLAPRYVSSALGVDPADAVYVFGPSAIGLGVALIASPRMIRLVGERATALLGFLVLATSLCLLGFIDEVAGALDWINPLGILAWFGIDLSEKMRTAGFLAMFAGFGLSLTTTAVQTYLNRRVPLSYQGRAFALQSTLKNASAILPLLALGAIATVTSVEAILIVTPVILLALAFMLVRVSYALGGEEPARRLDVLASFWEESQTPVQAPAFALPRDTRPKPEAKAEHDQEHHPA